MIFCHGLTIFLSSIGFKTTCNLVLHFDILFLKVGKVSATDKDLGENGRVTYSMSINPVGMFQLDPNNGKITLAKEPDREHTPSYQLTVTASDHGNPSQKTSVPVTVVIGDLNDNAPTFTQLPYTCQVGENLAGNVPVCNVKANDPDEGLNGKVSYSITGGNTGNVFSINQVRTFLTLLNTI